MLDLDDCVLWEMSAFKISFISLLKWLPSFRGDAEEEILIFRVFHFEIWYFGNVIGSGLL